MFHNDGGIYRFVRKFQNIYEEMKAQSGPQRYYMMYPLGHS